MCTIGVARLGDDEYILFKNKDFPRPSFDDRIVVEAGLFGVEGVATLAETNPDQDRFSGISLGANARGLLCADANVAGARGFSNYDDLVEIALRAGGGMMEGVAAIQAAAAERTYLWANIIMIDSVSACALEIGDNGVSVSMLDGPTVRSNHHVSRGGPVDGVGSPTSEDRLRAAQIHIASVRRLEDILDLQMAHDEGFTGICSHADSQTVYSYALHRRGSATSLYVTRGHPCQAKEPIELALSLGVEWSQEAAAQARGNYPSTRV